MNQIRTRLVEDHEMLDALLAQLAREAEDSDRQALQATWSELEKRLIAHLDAEEQYLLPLIEADNPVEVARTRREHGEIRDLIASSGSRLSFTPRASRTSPSWSACSRPLSQQERHALPLL